jgi:hypothetical protein
VPFPPEFELAAACCRWPPSPDRDRAVAEAAARGDWLLFERVAARHRIEGLAWEALRRARVAVPEATASALRAAAASVALQNLELARESARLRQAMEEAGARPIFVKGVTLAILAYGSLGLKKGWDIDLLVPPGEVEQAATALDKCGYRLAIPAGQGARSRLADWHVHWKESVWTDGRSHVELHSRLSDNPEVLRGVGPDSPTEEVEVAPGLKLPTLQREALFAYLCVHGASSAWFRLKWIADVGALLGEAGEAEIERLYERSQALGAGRSAAQALLLCARLFGTPLPPRLEETLRTDRLNRWLLAVALRKLAGRTAVAELEEVRLGTATIHLMQLALLPGLRFKLGEFARQLVGPYDRLSVDLPPRLRFLYPAVAITRRALRRRDSL